MPKISIVILTFNSRQFIELCLSSLFAQNSQDIEVIVVDNNSKDGTVDSIIKKYPQIILIENKENLGPCRARNQGIGVSSANWVLSLDCDVILDNKFIERILKIAENSTADIGMIQPKILNIDKKTVYSKGIFLSFMRKFYDIDSNEIDRDGLESSKRIFGCCAAAAVYRRQMLQEIRGETGYFDERFFFLVEDVDLSWRAQNKNWKAAYFPEAVCYHYGNSSSFNKKLRQYLCFRNRYYSIMKNEGLFRYYIKVFPLLFYDFPRFLYLVFTNRYIFNRPKLNSLVDRSM